MRKDTVLMSVAVVYKRGGGVRWFVVQQGQDSDWELPKTSVRKAESSVRASIRAMAEMGGMKAKVLEEAGRSGGSAVVNNKSVPVRHLYYLMVRKDGGEVLGYANHAWLEYAKAVKKLSTKRDRTMLKQARDLLAEIVRNKR